MSEWINVIAFAFFAILSSIRALPLRNRFNIILLCGSGLASITAAGFAGKFVAPSAASAIRDWLPAPLILFVYWAAGQFIVRPNERLESLLFGLDRRVFGWLESFRPARLLTRRRTRAIFEFFYALCYPLIPFGLVALYLAHRGRYADRFWTIVLGSTYPCYAALPFLPTRPPRTLEPAPRIQPRPGRVRRVNLWVVRHASIQVNTFPSGHVASSLSAALALIPLIPVAGWLFLLIAGGIAIGAFLGRYHYAADLIFAACIAVLVFFVVSALGRA